MDNDSHSARTKKVMKPLYATGLRVLFFVIVFEAGFIALSYLFGRALGNAPLSSEGQIIQVVFPPAGIPMTG